MMNQISLKFFLITICLFGQLMVGNSQTFSLVLHEFDDFPNIDEIIHGDFNNDGNLDFVISGTFLGEVYIGFGDGISKPVFSNIEADLNVFDLAAIDFDQDGNLDFVGSAVFEERSYVWLNDGAGNFTRKHMLVSDYSAIHFADLNEDGITNVVFGFDNRINLYNLVDGNMMVNKVIYNDQFNSIASIITLDYDDDGDLDIVASTNQKGIFLFRQEDDFEFIEENLYDQTFNDDEIFFDDLNKDGVIDFIVQSNFERRSSIILSTASSEYTEVDIPKKYSANLFTTVADFNRDDIVEIVMSEGESPVSAQLSFFNYNNMNMELDQTLIAEDHDDTEAGGVVDLDGDGDLDLYFFTNDFFDPGIVFYIQDGSLIVDLDGDGFSDMEDCDDNNPDINPGQTEIPYNEWDDDCNPETLDDDLDGDGFGFMEDCDDNNSAINPDAEEIANNDIDEDCDGLDLLLSTYEISNTSLSIYPNPASELIKVEVDDQLSFKVNLYNLDGKIIRSIENSNLMDVLLIPTGTYLLEINDLNSNQKIIEKIVIAR